MAAAPDHAIEGVANCGAPGGARELATTWLRANHLGWQKDGQMHEKYDATTPGARGGGGEYAPQVGWLNGGVVLWLLEKYGICSAPQESSRRAWTTPRINQYFNQTYWATRPSPGRVQPAARRRRMQRRAACTSLTPVSTH